MRSSLKGFFCFIFLFLGICCFSALNLTGEEFSQWQNRFKSALQSGNTDHIRPFFDPGFAAGELDSWKYQVQRGFLDFSSTRVIPLTKDALMIYIATDSSAYSDANFERYFDFIYRIYRIKAVPQSASPGSSAGFAVTARCMDDFNPDFLTCTETLELFPEDQTMSVDSEITADIKSNLLIFKLAKEFKLQSLTINGKEHPYQRFGYFVTAKVETPNPVTFRVKGNITAVSDHNQFFCIDDLNFFLRSGGFAATPSPPPDNRGRPYFSTDQAQFTRVIRFPAQYKFLAYGDIIKDETQDGKRTVTITLTEQYLDGLSFYAQTNWNVKSIQRGNVKTGFYFPGSARNEQEFLEKEITSLLDWLNRIFKKDSNSEFTINFVVLDKFVEEGLMNDGRSIIASRASIIGSGGGGYIHELCHTAPQPQIEGNVLWVKEGFTNYLAFNFLRDVGGETDFWKQQKRKYLHRFGLYCEPLELINNKGIPCYWSVYQKGPWIYRMLETELGKENFDKSMTAFGKNEGKKLADTSAYFKTFETVSGKDLATFRGQWLERKQNPVLRVKHTVTPSGKEKGGNLVTIHVSQEQPVFRFPLDIEIKTEKQTIRRTLQLAEPEEEIAVPIHSPLVSICFDPDDRVFAVIKDGTASFLKPRQILSPIPESLCRFKSDKDNSIVEFEIKNGTSGIDFFRREQGKEIHLELTRQLSPKTFEQDGDKVYSIDMEAGEIHFSSESYDIAEPVYPRGFAPVLFSMVDWQKTPELSFVCLDNSGYSSAVLKAVKEQDGGNDTVIRLEGFDSPPVKLYISAGMLIKYTIGSGENKETFSRNDSIVSDTTAGD